MEKIVNNRLRWLLENKKFFDKHQSAFRQYRSTLDSLVNLETNIHDAFINDQHLLTVSLDIEKCYEMVSGGTESYKSYLTMAWTDQ